MDPELEIQPLLFMKTPRATVLVFASCALVATSFGAGYLKIGDIKGEATDRDHKDWIIIESVSMDAAQADVRESPSKASTGVARDVASGQASGKREAASGMATGKRQHKPFVVTKSVDKASPKLAEACANGTVMKEVEIGEGGTRYKLKDVIITSIQSSSGGDRPMESLSLNYEKIEVTYDKDTNASSRESPRYELFASSQNTRLCC